MKKLLMIVTLLAMMLAMFNIAFADTVQVGAGTTTTTTLPISGNYGYNYTQQIYTQAQIDKSGDIDKIRFYYVSGPIANSKDWVIYMGHSTKTTFSTTTDWEPLANLTEVFNGDLTDMVPLGNNWMEITLTTPFSYNNSDNLIVAIDENTSGYSSMTWGSFVSGSNTAIYYRNDSTNPDPTTPPTASSRTGTIARIQFAFPNTSAPLAPTLMAPANGGWSFIDGVLSWSSTLGGADAADYDVYFGSSATPPLVSSAQTGTSYTPTLAAGTTYYWKVVANNEIGTSPASATWSFKTPSATQLAESFEDTTFPPAGWANGTTGNWFRGTSYKVHGLAGAYKSGSTTTQYTLSTPRVTITNGSTLDFWAAGSSITAASLQVVYSDDRVTWTQIGDDITYTATYAFDNHVIDLSDLAGNNYYLGFRTGTAGSSSSYVDMVFGPEITPESPGVPVLSVPADLAINVSEYPAFTWTAPVTGGIPTAYKLYVGTTDPPTNIVADQATLTYTYTSALAYETTYYWTVEAYNGNGTGDQAVVRSFTTKADPTLYPPFIEDFGTVSADWPVLNWTQRNGLYPTPTGTSSQWFQDDWINVTTPANKSAKINIYGTTRNGWLVTPPIAIPATGHELKFDLGLTDYSSTSPIEFIDGQEDDKFIVVISDSPDMSNPIILREWNNTGSGYVFNDIPNTGTSVTIDLSAHVGTKYIAFYGESTVSVTGEDNDLFVDSVQVRQTPSNPIFSYSPTEIDFGTVMNAVQVGPENVTITNNGGGTLNIAATDISIFGTNAAQFSFGTGNLPANLGVGQSVVIPVYVTATIEGPLTATLRIVNSQTRTNYDVALSADGLPAGIVTIGDGSSNLYMPVNTYYGYSYSQSIFLQSEIDVRDQRIEKVYYYWNGVGDANSTNDWTIYMGHTELTDFATSTSWIPLANLTQVFQGEVDLPATEGWIEIPLNAPFVYNNESNLVIAVDENEPGYNTSSMFFFNTATTTNRSIRCQNDSTNPDPATPPTGTLMLGHPNVMLALGDIPTGAPEHVSLLSPENDVTGVSPEDVILNWSPSLTGGIATYYGIFVGASRIDPSADYYGEQYFESTDTNLNLSAQPDFDLGYNNTWYWAVLPYNAEDESPDPTDLEFMVWNFTTREDPTIVSLPYEEYFDDVTAPALPWGWSNYINSTSTSAVVATYSSTTYAQSAPNSARLYNPSDADADLRLFTPIIDSSIPLNTIKLKFYARSSTAGYPLLVGTVDATDETGTFTQIQSIDLSATKTEYVISLADYAGTDQYICFKHGLGGSGRSLYIDDVQLIELLPNDLAALAITNPGIMAAGTAYDFTVDVFNEGTATQNAYTMKLMNQATETQLATLNVNTPLTPGATAQHTLSWTPTAGGTYSVYGIVVLTGDQSATNDETPTIDVYVVDNTMSIISVGDDESTTSGYNLPINLWYRNSVTEELYFPDEMHLQSGTIGAIVYKNTATNARDGKAIKIWMAHTTVTDLSGGWLPAENYNLVFDGTVDFPAGENYVVIPLTTPFNYTGGILATRVNRVFDSGTLGNSEKFFYTTNPDHSIRSRQLQNDTTVYDPLAPSATGSTLNYFPNTMFVVQNAVMQTGAILEGYVRDASNNPLVDATVSLTERAVTTTDATGFYQFTFWADTTVDATAAKATYYHQTITNLALTMGNTVTQNFALVAMPRVTISGTVTANDFPAGLVGATITLSGTENHSVLSGTGGAFSIPNVLGSVDGIAYTLTIAKDGYGSYSGTTNVLEAPVNLGSINLVEYLWTPYSLVATHSGDNAELVWDPAGEPDYLFFDFEAENGDWVGSGYGDWEWGNTYPAGQPFNWVEYDTSCVPPTAAYSGTGLWGTKLYTNHSNSSDWSYLSKTVDLAGFADPQLSFWRWNNLNGTYDYYQVTINGNVVLTENAVNNTWVEKVVDLSAYANQTVEIQFAAYASSVVAYAGLYIDDIYIGPATTRQNIAQTLGSKNVNRSFQNYSVYRLLAADEATPTNWTLLQSAYAGTSYMDTGFAALPGNKYKWAVVANYSGALESPALFSNSLGKVFVPQDIIATKVGTTVQLSWTAEPGASAYKVYASDDPYGTFVYLGSSISPSYTISNPGAKKFYHVTAVTDEALRATIPAK